MMIACHQARDSKPRLLLLSRELCHAHHHPANIMALLRKAYPVVLQQSSRWPVAVRVPRRRFSPLAWYNKQLEKSPVITKSITSGVLFGLGDVIAQLISVEKGEKFKLDIARMGRASIFGCFILGPLAHLHFNFLEWLVVRRLALSNSVMPFAKMFVDQFTYWAVSINTIYLFSIPKLEGRSNEECMDNVKRRLWPTMTANWMLWPLAQTINFKLIPVQHQLNYVLIVSLGWAAYLSWAGGKMAAKKKQEESQ